MSSFPLRRISFVASGAAESPAVPTPISQATRCKLIDSACDRRAQGIIWGQPCTPRVDKIALSDSAAGDYERLLGPGHPSKKSWRLYGEHMIVPYPFRVWLQEPAGSSLPPATPLNCISFVMTQLIEIGLLDKSDVHACYRAADQCESMGKNDPRYCSSLLMWMDGMGEWLCSKSAFNEYFLGDVVMVCDTRTNRTIHTGFFGGMTTDPESEKTGVLLWDWSGDVRREEAPTVGPFGGAFAYRRIPLEMLVHRIRAKAMSLQE